MSLAGFDPLVAEWFLGRFGAPSLPQSLGWPEIRAGHDVLISAPTGSGKTLAAFLICLDGLVKAARSGSLPSRTEVVYVSPLRALSNDIHKNLEAPLAEISELARTKGIPLAPIRAALRTGDTPQWERREMGKEPPHILVTTPESLFILLTSEKARSMLAGARTLILDEIHAVADDKRGSHLALSAVRLDRLTGARLQRIGLSATVKPIEAVAGFLGEDTRIVNVGHRRDMDLAIEVPRDELGPVASSEMWDEIYDRVAALTQEHRTTLIFVNTRRLAERVAHRLGERLGAGAVLPHHGSLSRKLRLNAEQRLKNGELRAVVATASLELGIDIGTVDLVCQMGSPRSISVALQRIGRAGHWAGATPKGRFFPTTRDELIECGALIAAIHAGELDRLEIPEAPLDVLAQQMVAAAANEDWSEDELFDLVRSAYPYRNLPRRDFDAVLTMLAEGIATSRGRSGAYLHHDGVNHRVRGRRGARLAAITSGGAIPDTAQYQVVAEPEGVTVGTVDEDFAVESLAGDVFLLGTTSWRILRVESGRVRVQDAQGAPPSIPFWRGEAPGRTIELSSAVSRLREAVDREESDFDPTGQALRYVRAGKAALGVLPTTDTVVAERFFDEAGGMQLVLHAPFGSRINRAWGLALRKRFCRTFNLELQAAATDNGLVISLSEQHAFPLDLVFAFLTPETVQHVLTQAMLASPMFTARWRWNLSRALATPRFLGGAKVPPPIQRMRSDDLMAAVFPDQAACAENLEGEIRIPDHPLVRETIENCLYEAMDLHGLVAVLTGIRSGAIRTLAVETPEPSVFCHEILNANPYAYLDDAPLEERRARAVQLRSSTRTDFSGGAGALDAAAIAEVEDEAWPVVRDADELHDALLTLCVLPPVPDWEEHFAVLVKTGRARPFRSLWMPVERAAVVEAAYAGDEESASAVVLGWLESIGPSTATALARRLELESYVVDSALARLESRGVALRGRFRPDAAETEWCHRRLLARIHRLTVGRLRREIEPVATAQFLRFLAKWQHAAPDAQLHGSDGLFQILQQLQGYEIPAAAWESEVLPRRVAEYAPELLDQLCLSGEVMWGRLSPHPAFESGDTRRVRPTRVAPITFFLRDDTSWLVPDVHPDRGALSHAGRETLAVIEMRGASFFNELARGAGRLPSEVEDALWELVAGGLVTADGFENLRSLLNPKRRRGEGSGRRARPRHAAGRWALLRTGEGHRDDEAFARQMLRRWGVVFRDLLGRETLAPPWRDLVLVLRRMEDRGEIRGGRFVSGYAGEQFALPEAVDLLRLVRRDSSVEQVSVAAADPLNLSGILLPGPRVSALSGERWRIAEPVAS